MDNLLDGIGFDSLDVEKINNKYELVKTVYDKKGILSDKYKGRLLKEIAIIKIGNSAPQALNLFEKGIYPFFRVSDLAREHISFNLTHTEDRLNENGIKGMTKFPKGTILFPKSGISAKKNHRGILGCEGYVVSHFACIIPNISMVDPYYLLYCLIKINAHDLMLNEGYPSIRKGTFEEIEIPVPTLNKQKEIVDEIYKIVELEKQVKKLTFTLDEKFKREL